MNGAAVDLIIERLRAASKYRSLHPDTVAAVVRQEAAHATSDRDLERRARLRLHRATAWYLFRGRPGEVRRSIEELDPSDRAGVRERCRRILAGHFSTAERLPDLDAFYPTVLELTGEPTGIADLACALNPFSLPWLRDVTAAPYTGYDFNLAYVELGAAFAARTDPQATVVHRDVLTAPREITADVALLLKTYHCIEDRSPGAGLRLVTEVGAARVVVSFPVRSMRGRAATFTRRHLDTLTAEADRRGWPVRTATLPTEEILLVTKKRHPPPP